MNTLKVKVLGNSDTKDDMFKLATLVRNNDMTQANKQMAKMGLTEVQKASVNAARLMLLNK